MELVRDLLDKQVIDRNGAKMGRVDGIIAELQADGTAKVIAIEMGSLTMARRIGVRTARLVAWFLARTASKRHAKSYQVPINAVCEIGLDVRLHLEVRDTPVHDWQTWLRENIVGRIPGAHQ
jgi:sporulation protein YlmC with PRC-barrel domain